MSILQNVPIFLVLLPLGLSSVCAILKPRASKYLFFTVNLICCAVTVLLTIFVYRFGGFTQRLGEVGAPFGNELYVSSAECVMLLLFAFICLLSMSAGLRRAALDVNENRQSLFFTVSLLMFAAINAITLTNDLFTGYVFLEITTIAAAALIFVRSHEGSLFASVRYLIMNLLGSGLFLLGLAVFYCLTGELLFPQLKSASNAIVEGGRYMISLRASLLLMTLGIAIKSALYPFHTWLPNAYSGTTPAASSFLSSLISKAYIFLYIKIILRGTGPEAFRESGASDIVFAYACMANVMGSIDAIKEHNIRRMVSYSSVAQIGYIFLAVSLGTHAGYCAAILHIIVHSCSKAMLFPAVDRLIEVSGENENFRDLRGSGYRAPIAGIAFTIGAFSITGIPLLGGFTSKVFIASAAAEAGTFRMWLTLAVLAISTVLNIIYFLRTVITIYRRGEHYPIEVDRRGSRLQMISFSGFILINLFLGFCGEYVMKLIRTGLLVW